MSSKVPLLNGNLVEAVVQLNSTGTIVSPATQAGQDDIYNEMLVMQTTLGSIDGKTPSLGRAAASASTPVALSNEDVQDLNIIGQAGQIGTVNNIISVTAGSAGTDVNGYRSGSIALATSGSVTGGNLLLEASADNATNWNAIPYVNQNSTQTTPSTSTSSVINPSFSVGNAILNFAIPARYLRLKISSAITGGGSIQAISRFSQTPYSPMTSQVFIANGQTAHSAAIAGNPVRIAGAVTSTLDTTLVNADASNLMMTTAGQAITKAFGTAENDWSYAAASGGILNTTTAVTIKTAGATSIRNYVTALQIVAETLGSATELAIRDGAGGTVLYRIKIPAAGGTFNAAFYNPLKGTAATLLEVVTLTASVTGAVYFNAQGYQSF